MSRNRGAFTRQLSNASENIGRGTGWLRERYLIIYSASEAIAVNCAAKINETLPGWLIFASNGGGTSYLIRVSEESPTPVYRCEDVDIGATEPERIAGSIEEFLATFGPAFA